MHKNSRRDDALREAYAFILNKRKTPASASSAKDSAPTGEDTRAEPEHPEDNKNVR